MAIEEQVLSEISRSVSRVSESSESFRIAATQHNNNIQRVVKDISSMFRAQTSNQEELSSAIGDLKDEMAETNDKTDAVATRLNDTVNVQNSMLSELRGIGKSIDQLNNMMQMFFMQGGSGGSGGGGGAGGLGGGGLGGGGSAIATLFKLAMGGVAIGAGAAGLNQLRARLERGEGLPTYGGGVPLPQSSPTTAMAAGASSAGNNTDQISQILASIKRQETRGESDPYTSIARGEDNKPLPLGPNTGTGAYQFTPATWQESARAANIDVSQYPQARDAPPELQDRVARARAEYLLQRGGGDISAVPAYWRGGENIDLQNLSPTVTQYRQEVMANYQQNQQAAQQQNTTPTSTAGTSNDYAQFLQSRSQNGVNAEQLNPTFAAKLMKAIEEAERVTGEKVTITSGFRTPEQQAQLFANHIREAYTYNGKVYMPNAPQIEPVAEPGKSQHQTGHAVDLSRGAAREYIRKNAGKFGLIDLAGDPPHFSDAPENQTAATQTAPATPPTTVGAPTTVGETPQSTNQQTTQQGAAEMQPQSPLMAGLGMPAGMGPGSEPGRIGMGDMNSYNPLAILGTTLGGNMLMPSGQAGAVGAALNMLSTVSNRMEPEETRPPQTQQQQQSSQPRGRIEPDTYNHPEDRTVSPSWMDRLLGIYPNETSGVNTTYVGRDH